MAEGSTLRLLAAVWGTRAGFVFLPWKDLDRIWHEAPGVPYDGVVPSINEPHGDVYFCPVVFSQPHRKKEFALPTNLLWADLDPIHPEQCRLKPSIAWESSPGRYQALWFLSTEVSASDAASMSKRIAYADGADKGGWDVTQVLRLPGTRNYKYESAPPVKLLWAKRSAYSVSEVLAAYPAVNGDSMEAANGEWPIAEEGAIQAAIHSLPIGLRKRLTRDAAGADRSLELQKLARDLIRFGTAPHLVAHLLQRSTFNKFAGRSDEHAQLLKQVLSAQSAVAKPKTAPQPQPAEPIEAMQVHTWASFMQQQTTLRWLVDDAWVDQTVGFISGRSKSYKTWIALDLALSIASGANFLGRYPVRKTGPVLLIQEEDPASILQDRLRLIAKSKGMLPKAEVKDGVIHLEFPEFPIKIINLQGFNLGHQERVDQVRHLIAEMNPVMVILDPLIVLLPQGVDEYKGTEVAAVLQSVKMWREEFHCSIVIVHHWNKTKNETGERFAEHMYGSFQFHAWLESALHVMPLIEEENERIDRVVVEREFKAAPSGRALKLHFQIDTIKNYTYNVEFEDEKALTPRAQQIIDLIGAAGGGTTTPELVAMTGIPRPKLVEEMGRLVRIGVVKARKGGGRGRSTVYWLPDQPEPPTESG